MATWKKAQFGCLRTKHLKHLKFHKTIILFCILNSPAIFTVLLLTPVQFRNVLYVAVTLHHGAMDVDVSVTPSSYVLKTLQFHELSTKLLWYIVLSLFDLQLRSLTKG